MRGAVVCVYCYFGGGALFNRWKEGLFSIGYGFRALIGLAQKQKHLLLFWDYVWNRL